MQREQGVVIPSEIAFGRTIIPSPKELVESLRMIQAKAGVNQKEMAETLGIGTSMLSKVFSGTRRPPSDIGFYTNLRNLPNITEEDLNLWTIPGSALWGKQEFRAQARPVEGINFAIYADPKVLDDEEVTFLRDEVSEAIRGVIERTEARRKRIQQFFDKRGTMPPPATLQVPQEHPIDPLATSDEVIKQDRLQTSMQQRQNPLREKRRTRQQLPKQPSTTLQPVERERQALLRAMSQLEQQERPPEIPAETQIPQKEAITESLPLLKEGDRVLNQAGEIGIVRGEKEINGVVNVWVQFGGTHIYVPKEREHLRFQLVNASETSSLP